MGLVFIVLLVLAAIVFALATRLSVGVWRQDSFSAVSPVTLTPLSVVFGFLIGFLALQVWGDWDRARQLVAQEASALRETVILTNAVDPDLAKAVDADIAVYLAGVPKEWEAMGQRRLRLSAPPPGLVTAVRRVIAFEAASPQAQRAADHALVALDRALEARRARVLISEAGVIGLPKWVAATLLAMLLQLSIAVVHAHHRGGQAVALAIFTAAACTSLGLVAAFDHPFRSWPRGVPPDALMQIDPTSGVSAAWDEAPRRPHG